MNNIQKKNVNLIFQKSILTQKKSQSRTNREIPALSLERFTARLCWFICWTGKIFKLLLLVYFSFLDVAVQGTMAAKWADWKETGWYLFLKR